MSRPPRQSYRSYNLADALGAVEVPRSIGGRLARLERPAHFSSRLFLEQSLAIVADHLDRRRPSTASHRKALLDAARDPSVVRALDPVRLSIDTPDEPAAAHALLTVTGGADLVPAALWNTLVKRGRPTHEIAATQIITACAAAPEALAFSLAIALRQLNRELLDGATHRLYSQAIRPGGHTLETSIWRRTLLEPASYPVASALAASVELRHMIPHLASEHYGQDRVRSALNGAAAIAFLGGRDTEQRAATRKQLATYLERRQWTQLDHLVETLAANNALIHNDATDAVIDGALQHQHGADEFLLSHADCVLAVNVGGHAQLCHVLPIDEQPGNQPNTIRLRAFRQHINSDAVRPFRAIEGALLEVESPQTLPTQRLIDGSAANTVMTLGRAGQLMRRRGETGLFALTERGASNVRDAGTAFKGTDVDFRAATSERAPERATPRRPVRLLGL